MYSLLHNIIDLFTLEAVYISVMSISQSPTIVWILRMPSDNHL